MLARALGKDSDLMVWVLADRRPDAVEAVGEDGLDEIDADALPCDGQHASTLCQAARLMCSGMHTPAERWTRRGLAYQHLWWTVWHLPRQLQEDARFLLLL